MYTSSFPGGSVVKSLSARQGMQQEPRFQPLGWGDPLEEEMATHSNVLIWEITWTEEPGRLQFTGLQRVGYNLATEHTYIGETQENWVTHQDDQSTNLKYHLWLKTKNDFASSGLECQGGGRQFTWRRKIKWLVNKCLLGHAETLGHRVDYDLFVSHHT